MPKTKPTARRAKPASPKEYDFSKGTRGKYAAQIGAVITLDPDVAAAFPTAQAVNDALRMLAQISVQAARKRSRAVRRPRTA